MEFLWPSVSLLILANFPFFFTMQFSPSCSGKSLQKLPSENCTEQGSWANQEKYFPFLSPSAVTPATRQQVHGDLGKCLCPEAVARFSPAAFSQGEVLPWVGPGHTSLCRKSLESRKKLSSTLTWLIWAEKEVFGFCTWLTGSALKHTSFLLNRKEIGLNLPSPTHFPHLLCLSLGTVIFITNESLPGLSSPLPSPCPTAEQACPALGLPGDTDK